MLSTTQVKDMIEKGLAGASAEVNDLTGTGDHFEATVVSEAFTGQSLIKQHQLVYAALGDAMAGPVHALKLKTMTPEQAK
ncbi:MAG TPA: BolA family transcriptional regulator [Myxococcales bacterium]|nr:BolA family transcriptional regulator [Myxococcales bacterium]HIN86990.1 BolA family transcriptional regulator [Myxococcales bacterium]